MIKPCRSTCDTLRRDCAHAFESIEMAWPYFLDCDRFFASEREGCFDPLAGLKGKGHAVVLYVLIGPIAFLVLCERNKASFSPSLASHL